MLIGLVDAKLKRFLWKEHKSINICLTRKSKHYDGPSTYCIIFRFEDVGSILDRNDGIQPK
jgi:hypothetical protein